MTIKLGHCPSQVEKHPQYHLARIEPWQISFPLLLISLSGECDPGKHMIKEI